MIDHASRYSAGCRLASKEPEVVIKAIFMHWIKIHGSPIKFLTDNGGEFVNESRFDQQKYTIFEKLTERQLSFFWRPEEIDLTIDRVDFTKFSYSEKGISPASLSTFKSPAGKLLRKHN